MNKGGHHWTEEVIEEFTKMLRTGISHSRCAEALNEKFGGRVGDLQRFPFTRDACIGKAHRLGFRTAKTIEPKKASAAKRMPKKATGMGVPEGTIIIELAPIIDPSIPREGVPIEELKTAQCRYELSWDYEDASKFKFCAQPIHAGSSYCKRHFDIVTTKPTPRRRR